MANARVDEAPRKRPSVADERLEAAEAAVLLVVA
jgi:hypothetical protein